VIARLEALEDWTRNLGGVLTAGIGLEQAIISSERAVPDAIKAEVSLLVSRLRVHWNTEQALRSFADDLNDATGDRVATSLIASSKSSGTDLAAVLDRIAASVSDEVRMRRQIEADRGKPRSSARIITVVALVGVLVIAASTGGYGQPYLTSAGQVWAVIWLGLGLGCLLWMRQIGSSRRIARFLGESARLRTAK
jgi:Flp pilus assembly protein TadB